MALAAGRVAARGAQYRNVLCFGLLLVGLDDILARRGGNALRRVSSAGSSSKRVSPFDNLRGQHAPFVPTQSTLGSLAGLEAKRGAAFSTAEKP